MKGYNNSKLPVHMDMECRRPFGENDKFELKVGDEICNNAHVREIIYEIACRRYRDIRRTYYSHYQAYETDEARLQNPPNDAMSERNKANRSKQLTSHETVRDKLEESSSQSCSLAAPTLEKVLTSIVGQRSGHIRGRGCGPRPTPKSVVTAATIAGLQV
ncbi:hypothetical protein Taro_039687 [Colocasia esculenta]|uniref:Uncharacterized protein n=1 Tax=Colocasia esculenta TaxID=4460 RepID=A0A843WGH0_COLES|nr:hypothetical protein [Colocasia esculenta]